MVLIPSSLTLIPPPLQVAAGSGLDGSGFELIMIGAVILLLLALRSLGTVIRGVGGMVRGLLVWLFAAMAAYAGVALVLVLIFALLLGDGANGAEATAPA